MDNLDVKVLRLLIQGAATSPLDPDFRKSYRIIAKAAGVDEGTVRYRVRRFRETGFFREWRCCVNPLLLRAGAAIAIFDVPDSIPKDELMEELQLVPGVYYIARHFGNMVAVVMLYQEKRSLERRVELIRRMAKAKTLTLAKVAFPESDSILSRSDWMLIRSLFENPRKPCGLLSREIGLSSRTVGSKLRRLSDDGVLFALPALNPKALRGAIMSILLVTYPSNRKEELDRKIAPLLEPYLWQVFHMLPFEPSDAVHCIFNVMLPNVSVAQEVLRWILKLEGVTAARVELIEEVITIYEPFVELVAPHAGAQRGGNWGSGPRRRAPHTARH